MLDRERCGSFHESLVKARHLIHGHMKLPTPFTHVGKTKGPNGNHAHGHFPGNPKTKGLLGKIGIGEWLQEFNGLRAHHTQDPITGSHLRDGKLSIFRSMPPDPMSIMMPLGRGGHQIINIFSLSHQGQIRLVTSLVVEHTCVDRSPYWNIDLVGTEPLKGTSCILTLNT